MNEIKASFDSYYGALLEQVHQSYLGCWRSFGQVLLNYAGPGNFMDNKSTDRVLHKHIASKEDD